MNNEKQLLTWVHTHYEAFYQQATKDKYSKKQRADQVEIHIQQAVAISKEIFKRIKKREGLADRMLSVVVAGAYLHDIEKLNEGLDTAKHQKLGKLYLENNRERLEVLDFTREEFDLILEMVAYHNKGKYKSERVAGELVVDSKNALRPMSVKIIQDADKISKLYKNKGKEVKKAYPKKWHDYSQGVQQEIILATTPKGLNLPESEKLFGELFDQVK